MCRGQIWRKSAVADVIIFAKFQENRFRGYGPPGGRKSPSSIDLAHRSYNTVSANMLQCDDERTDHDGSVVDDNDVESTDDASRVNSDIKSTPTPSITVVSEDRQQIRTKASKRKQQM